MYLASLRVRNVGPFDDATISFADVEGTPRPVTVLFGDSGSGKTTLLAAIAATRPGFAAGAPRARSDVPAGDAFAVTRWRLGEDDPARPHDLVVASPNADLREPPTDAAARKREQAHFDRVAVEQGFCVVPLSTARWGGRVVSTGAAPDRPPSAMDHRTNATLDDASRADLAREVKQGLVNAVTVAALQAFQARARSSTERTSYLPPAPAARSHVPMHDLYRQVFQALLPDGEASFEGIDPNGFDPLFRDPSGRLIGFDDLGFGVKNRILIGGVLLRRLSLAYPGRNPLECEGVALIDEVEAHLPVRRQREIVEVLHRTFPRLQLIVATQSPFVAESRPHDEVFVLSRDLETGGIAVSMGPASVLH